MDCVVYRRTSCIALIMFRKGPAHIQMTRHSPCPPSLTYLVRSLSGIVIEYSHHVIFLFCVECKFIKTAVCRFKGRVRARTGQRMAYPIMCDHRERCRFYVVQILRL